MKIGEVARKAGLKPSAIRYYEQVGLLPPSYRKSGRRDYDGSIFQFLAVIRIARACGFTIREIQRLVRGFPNHVSPAERWREMAEMKVAELKRRTTEMESMIEILRKGLACNCRDLSECLLVREELSRARAGGDSTQSSGGEGGCSIDRLSDRAKQFFP